MEKTAPQFKKYLFVCVNERQEGKDCCGQAGKEIRDELKAYVKSRGLASEIRVSQSGCLDVCAQGPNVIVYPDNVWYKKVSKNDIAQIIAEQVTPLEKKSSKDKPV